MNNNSIVDEIKSRCDIVDVIGRYVALKRAGGSYKGLCPFHNEKTPSFVVSGNKQFFKCFGCGESGDVISFIMKIENLDFQNAVSKLCDMYGIDMDRFGFRNESHKNKVFEINREAAIFFFHNLTGRANRGLDYMLGRGLDSKTITRFGIGFADDKWNDLTNYLKSKGYSEEFMYEAGLISRSQKNGRYFDKFRNRVMFPIFNTRGKVIGFGGRDLGNRGPKYLNSPESPVFSKKNNLYGLNITRQDITNSNQVIIVEGYMDLVSLYQHGIKNVAATLGTALTDNQCQLLKRYTENAVLSYDADAAGQAAALRGLGLLHSAGMKSHVLHVTDGKDPDEFIRKKGKEAFIKLVDGSLNYIEYIISVLKKRHDISTEDGIVDFIKELSPYLKQVSPVESDIYIKKVSDELNVYESTIRRQLESASGNSIADEKNQKNRSKETINSSYSGKGNTKLQMNFIKLLAVNPGYIEKIKEYRSQFTDPIFARIFSIMENIYNEDSDIDIRKVADSLANDSQEYVNVFRNILSSIAIDPKDADLVLDQNIKSIKNNELKIRKRELVRQIKKAEGIPNKDPESEKQLDVLYKNLMLTDIELQKMK